MARSQSMIVFDAKMYRHFAIVTVALTAAIALFADGEKRAIVTETAVAAQEYVEEVDLGTPKLVIRNANAGGPSPGLAGFYSDVGQNIYGTGFATGSSHETQRYAKLVKSITDEQLAQLGLTKEQFLALSDNEKTEILAKLNNGVSPIVSESVVKNSSAESLRRSGRSGQSADY
ncbi:hypothetical protein QWY75_05005 [Pontixanthobacter aestiaquae]|uniref:Uncharacterized protein n=1 Tax=Pontixanthobacter aestiaquae TaxID=1509367 RepID=A0A844Z8N5_9SPHN|nr:hypothetical protein [Pontixanthobacter aestiaquae]MDN3645566.1 hypothetical protein [Pontixanthobacter aestiaquae]MXO83437.1 hypothetical protein [Pontixanthobacter aestiaquae]